MHFEPITSRKNPVVTGTARLSDKKEREKTGLFFTEGIKLFEEALSAGLSLKRLFCTQKAVGAYGLSSRDLPCGDAYLVTDEVYEKLSCEQAPQGIFACFGIPEIGDALPPDTGHAPLLILEDVQNPANFGAILRCAFGFGVENVLFSAGCADPFSPKCVRAAMGSLFKMRLFRTDDTASAVTRIRENGVRVFGAALDRASLRLGTFPFSLTDAVVIGNEGHGLSDAVLGACDGTVYIPMNEGAESLNAATAAAVILWEMRKSRPLI